MVSTSKEVSRKKKVRTGLDGRDMSRHSRTSRVSQYTSGLDQFISRI